MSSHWYVLRVKPHKERLVFGQLQQRGLDVYFPLLKVKPVNPRAAKERPYFPGYMFVKVDLVELGRNALSWLPGTHGLVTFGDVPATVPPNMIDEIKTRLAIVEANGGLRRRELKKGDKVRITDGLFAGYEAIFDMHLPGEQRVQVLLAFLSQAEQPVQLDSTHVQKR
jgi:transcription antitermination factor NusG